MRQASSVSSIRSAARREVAQEASTPPGATVTTAEHLNGWHPGLAIGASRSAPVLPTRRHLNLGSDKSAAVDVSPPKRFRQSHLAPIDAAEPSAYYRNKHGSSSAADAAPVSPTAHYMSPRRSESPRRAAGSTSPRKESGIKQSPAFLAPQRDTEIFDGGEKFACAAPGYYDKSVYSAPWSLAGGINTSHLSSAFLASGRPHMLLPAAAASSAEKGPGPSGAGGGSGGGGDGPSSPSGVEETLGVDEKHEAAAEAHKLRRQQREIAKMIAKGRQTNGAKPTKLQHHDPHATMSPAMIQADDGSLARQLAKKTRMPATDCAIEMLIQMSNRELTMRDFLKKADAEGDAEEAAPAPKYSEYTPTMSFSTLAYKPWLA